MLKCYQCDGNAVFTEKGANRLFCHPDHHVMYQKGWSTLLDYINKDAVLKQRVWTRLGMKRGLSKEEPPPIVLNHLENLPDDMVGEILLYVFHDVGLKDSITTQAIQARDISVRLRKMIDLYILGPVKELSLGIASGVTDQNLSPLFPKMETLRLYSNTEITDAGLRPLARLKVLDLSRNTTITDRGLSTLSSLERLILYASQNITDKGVSQLPQLKWLDLSDNGVIEGDCLSYLTQLECLRLESNVRITGTHLVGVSRTLKCLNLDYNSVPNLGNAVRRMTNLEELSLRDNGNIMDKHLVRLTQLKILIIPMHSRITLAGLSALAPQLTYLDLWDNMRVKNQWLDPFRGRDTMIILSEEQMLSYNVENLRFIAVTIGIYLNKLTMRRLLKEQGIVLCNYEMRDK